MGRATGMRAVLAACALLAACTSSASGSGFHPSFQTAPCPNDLEFLLIPTHSCGHLTVLEDRSRPAGRTIRLFVVRIEPQAGRPADGAAMFVPGEDLGMESDIYGVANMAQRVDREVLLMDQRGSGRSQPSLDCPEIDAVTPMALRAGIGATSSRTAFFAAVARCRARLTEEGVDLAAYDLPAMAQDGVDLRHALGIDTWGITTYGSMSLVGLEMLREDPAHIDAMVLDSPAFPQEDPLTTAVTSTMSAIKAIFHDCAVRARCAAAYPRLPQTLHRAIGHLDDHPITVSTETASGHRFDVRVDGAALLRALRTLLRDQTDASFASEPVATYTAADGDVSSIVAPLLAFSPAFCAGYLPTCDEAHAVSEGTYLSVMCRDFGWSEGHGEATGSTSTTRGLSSEVFAADPWVEACTGWNVPPADPSVNQLVTSDIPILILLGRYDPYAAPSVVRPAAETLTRRWVVVNRSGGHNALSQSCMIEIRNAWIRDPTSPPDRQCLSSIPPKPFAIDR